MPDSLRIITERLLLRSLRLDDAFALFNYRYDALANQYQGWIPKTLSDALNFINTGISPTIDIAGTWYQVAMIRQDEKKLIGDIGIHFFDPLKYQVEIGFTVDKNEQGRGYATEALTALIDYLFNELNKHRIVASIDPRNEKSIALVTRLGFRKEAHFKQSLYINGEWTDDLIYALLKQEWLGKN